MKNSFTPIKINRSRRLFENQSRIKIIREKTEFFKIYLKIGVLNIKFKNWNLDIKFKRNWNFEN